MLVWFILSLVFASSRQETVLKITPKSLGALEYKTAESYKFKGIPDFPELSSGEKRETYHYEQTIVVQDSGLDNTVHRCEIMEV